MWTIFLMKNYYVDILVQQQISDLYGKISKKKKNNTYCIALSISLNLYMSTFCLLQTTIFILNIKNPEKKLLRMYINIVK